MNIQKIGGLGSLVNAVHLIVILFLINDVSFDTTIDFDTISASYNTVGFLGSILGALGYITFVLALRERMQEGAPILIRMAIIGVSITCALWLAGALIGIVGMPSIITAKDASAYRAVENVIISILTAGDFAAGWVLLLIGCASVKMRGLPLILSWLFIIKGIDMILSFAIQPLVLVGMLLGIIFYPWLGIVLLRSKD